MTCAIGSDPSGTVARYLGLLVISALGVSACSAGFLPEETDQGTWECGSATEDSLPVRVVEQIEPINSLRVCIFGTSSTAKPPAKKDEQGKPALVVADFAPVDQVQTGQVPVPNDIWDDTMTSLALRPDRVGPGQACTAEWKARTNPVIAQTIDGQVFVIAIPQSGCNNDLAESNDAITSLVELAPLPQGFAQFGYFPGDPNNEVYSKVTPVSIA